MTTFDYDTELGMLYWDQYDSQFELPPSSTLDQDALATGIYNTEAFGCSTHPARDASATLQSISSCSSGVPYMANLYSRTNSHLQSGYTTSTDNTDPEPIDSLSGMVERTHMRESSGSSSSSSSNEMVEICGNSLPNLKLHSGSRKPKRRNRKRQDVPEKILQARELHNNVERRYRTRLKLRFQNLLAVLQASQTEGDGLNETCPLSKDRTLSKGEILDVAAQRILTLEKVNRQLLARQE